jgi:hypothetical protein
MRFLAWASFSVLTSDGVLLNGRAQSAGCGESPARANSHWSGRSRRRCYTNGVSGLTALLNPNTLTWTATGSGKRNPWGYGQAAERQRAGRRRQHCGGLQLGNVSPTTWSVVGTDDFDGDGMADILQRDTSGDVAISFMNGTTVKSTAPVWTVVGTGDFSGDRTSDIVWRNNAGDVAIWLMKGAAVSSAGGLGDVGATWSIVQTGDYDGDGMSDLLWHDNLGNTAIWFMHGVTVFSTGAIGNVPPSGRSGNEHRLRGRNGIAFAH